MLQSVKQIIESMKLEIDTIQKLSNLIKMSGGTDVLSSNIGSHPYTLFIETTREVKHWAFPSLDDLLMVISSDEFKQFILDNQGEFLVNAETRYAL